MKLSIIRDIDKARYGVKLVESVKFIRLIENYRKIKVVKYFLDYWQSCQFPLFGCIKVS
jgi:hypothetical protein